MRAPSRSPLVPPVAACPVAASDGSAPLPPGTARRVPARRAGRVLLAAAAGACGIAQAAVATPVQATYEVRAAGLRIMEVEAVIDLDALRAGGPATRPRAGNAATQPRAYAIELRTTLRGVATALGAGGGVSRASGTWRGDLARPAAFESEGVWRGEPRRVRMDYPGGQPAVRQLVPADEDEREPVPEAARRDTLDSLSVLAQLMRNVADSNRCEGRAAVFDGRRRLDFTAVTEGVQALAPSGESWAGEALRCRFEGNQVAGFLRDQALADRRPQQGVAWLAVPRPGAPPIPVRLEVPSRWFGAITATLVRVAAPGGAGAANGGPAVAGSAGTAPAGVAAPR